MSAQRPAAMQASMGCSQEAMSACKASRVALGQPAASGASPAQGAELLDELAAQGEQVTEQNQVAWLGRSCLEAIEVAESGEHDGIDAVVPGETA